MCGEKQSLKQIFFHGSSKDCRHYVQQRNMNQQKRNFENEENLQLWEDCEYGEDEDGKQEFPNCMYLFFKGKYIIFVFKISFVEMI